VVVGSLFAVQTIVSGIYYSFSVFYVAVLEEFGWSRAAMAGVFSVNVLVSGLTGAVAGILVDRFGPRRVLPVGAALYALALAATSRISAPWEYYFFFGIVGGVGYALVGWVPCIAVVSRWFSARRGAAMGIAGAGIGLGIAAVVPLSQYLISGFGWRSAYLILAALVLFGVIPQVELLLVDRPEDLGLTPDGLPPSPGTGRPLPAPRTVKMAVVDQEWASRPWTVTSAMRTHRFWLLLGVLLFGVFTNQMLWVHQVAYLVDAGYGKMLAASIVGLAGFLSIPGKILWGAAGDRLGRERAYTAGISIMLLAIVLLMLTSVVPALWLVLLFAVVFPFGYAVTAPMGPAAAADIFAGKHFGAIFGVLNFGIGVGSALGPLTAGYVFDLTGSYVVAFCVGAVSSSAAVACMWLAAPGKVRRLVRGA